ncbi:MAG: hypothetical protein AAF288_01570 [Planctomycetota bacterium]
MKLINALQPRVLMLGLGAAVAFGSPAVTFAQDDDRPSRERGDRGERAERGERGDRAERGERGRNNPGRAVRALLRDIDLEEDQRELVGEVMEELRGEMEQYAEDTEEVRAEARAAREDGDREAMQAAMEKLREFPRPDLEAYADKVRDILTDEQRETFDKNREEIRERMEERRKRMEERRENRGEDGERPRRGRRGGPDAEASDDDS